jgi:hypothetical protein
VLLTTIAVFGAIVGRVSPIDALYGARTNGGPAMRGGGIIGTIVLVWLIIGIVAAYQRDYFTNSETSCGTAGTIALTVIAGPLNYIGANPKVTDCHIPQPSQ